MSAKFRILAIGQLRLAIQVPSELPWAWPAGPLSQFAGQGSAADVRVAVRVGIPEAPPAETLRYDSRGGIFDVAEQNGEVVIALRIQGELHRVARFDPGFHEGEVVIAPGSPYARDVYYPLAYPLDEVIFLHRIAREGGLLLHGCGVVRGQGPALLFTGPSGAGKTTISRLMMRHAGASVLSDDRLVLRPDGLGGIRVWGTPWHGDGELSLPQSATLGAIHVIRHAPAILAEPLTGGTAAASVLSNAFVPAHDRVGASRVLDFAADLVSAVPVIRLGFPKDERVVRYAFGPAALAESMEPGPRCDLIRSQSAPGGV